MVRYILHILQDVANRQQSCCKPSVCCGAPLQGQHLIFRSTVRFIQHISSILYLPLVNYDLHECSLLAMTCLQVKSHFDILMPKLYVVTEKACAPLCIPQDKPQKK